MIFDARSFTTWVLECPCPPVEITLGRDEFMSLAFSISREMTRYASPAIDEATESMTLGHTRITCTETLLPQPRFEVYAKDPRDDELAAEAERLVNLLAKQQAQLGVMQVWKKASPSRGTGRASREF